MYVESGGSNLGYYNDESLIAVIANSSSSRVFTNLLIFNDTSLTFTATSLDNLGKYLAVEDADNSDCQQTEDEDFQWYSNPRTNYLWFTNALKLAKLGFVVPFCNLKRKCFVKGEDFCRPIILSVAGYMSNFSVTSEVPLERWFPIDTKGGQESLGFNAISARCRILKTMSQGLGDQQAVFAPHDISAKSYLEVDIVRKHIARLCLSGILLGDSGKYSLNPDYSTDLDRVVYIVEGAVNPTLNFINTGIECAHQFVSQPSKIRALLSNCKNSPYVVRKGDTEESSAKKAV